MRTVSRFLSVAFFALCLPLAAHGQEATTAPADKSAEAWKQIAYEQVSSTSLPVVIKSTGEPAAQADRGRFYVVTKDRPGTVASDDTLVTNSIDNAVKQELLLAKVTAEVLGVKPENVKRVSGAFWSSPEWIDMTRKAVGTGPRVSRPADEKVFLVVARGTGYLERSGPHVVQIHLAVAPESGPPIPKDKTQALARRLAEAVAVEFNQHFWDSVRESTDYDAKVGELKKQLTAADEVVAQKRREVADNPELPMEEELASTLQDTDRQLLQARLTERVMKVREAAIQRQIEEATAKIQKRVGDNDMLRNLARIADLRKSRFERLKRLKDRNDSTVTAEDVENAEEQMLSAIVELDRTKAAFQKSEGSERVTALETELSKLAIDREEATVRHEFLEMTQEIARQRLAERRKLDIKLAANQKQLAAATGRQRSLQMQLQAAEELATSLQSLKATVADAAN